MHDDEIPKIRRGPKIKTLDWDIFERLLKRQCTQEEVAGTFGMSVDTLETRCMQEKGMKYSELKKIFGGAGRASLRARLWRQAFNDKAKSNVQAAIWLSKQYLDMKDKIEDTRFENLQPLIIETSKCEIKLGLEEKKQDEH